MKLMMIVLILVVLEDGLGGDQETINKLWL